MLTEKKKLDIIAFLSVIPLAMAMQMVDTPLNWIMYVFVFFSGIDQNYTQVLKRSSIVSFLLAIVNFLWVVPSSKSLIGNGGIFIGIILLLIFCLFFIIYAGLVSMAFVCFRWHDPKSKYAGLLSSIIAGCILGATDIIMSWIGNGFSSCMFYNYLPLSFNIYALQPIAYMGPFILSFLLGMTNYQIAYFLKAKKYKFLIIPIILIMGYIGLGKLLYTKYISDLSLISSKSKSLKVATICTDFDIDHKWDISNGNIRINQLFTQNKEAIGQQSDIAIWSESVVPWLFTPHDDFLSELATQNNNSKMYYLIGINTGSLQVQHNSVFSFAPDGKELGRYDKTKSLYILEKDLFGFGPSSFLHKPIIESGISVFPLTTKQSKAGILLKNEITNGNVASKLSKNGANFLVYLGDDSRLPFYIAKQHFCYARVRAVENRKDMIVNNKGGFSGMIQSTGAILNQKQYGKPINLYNELMPNNDLPFLEEMPYTSLSLILGGLLFLVIEIANIKYNRHRWSN